MRELRKGYCSDLFVALSVNWSLCIKMGTLAKKNPNCVGLFLPNCCFVGRQTSVAELEGALWLRLQATEGATLQRPQDLKYYSSRGSKIVAPCKSLLESILCNKSDGRGL
jgi:hypothetical protein